MAIIVDHIQAALNRLIIQYQESQTVADYLSAVMVEVQELEDVYCDLIDKRFIDTATDDQLDIIGRIVGQPRLVGGVVLDTDDYRLFIRARIVKNNTRATYEEVIEMVLFILGGADSVQLIEGDRSYQLSIGRVLTSHEKDLITNSGLIPKPNGIGVTYALFDPAEAFEFTSVTGPDPGIGKGFGTIADPLEGGTFVSITP